jgi:hypothetical protein
LLIRNISSVYHIVAMRVIKYPGHTYEKASVLCFLEPGYDNFKETEGTLCKTPKITDF